jgi:hypothetical protein
MRHLVAANWRAVIFYAFALLSFTASAADAEQRLALVIGNTAYQNIGQLANAANDAKLMAATLSSLKFEVTLHLNANQKQMKSALLDFSEKINNSGRDSVVLLYYAGHGVQISGQNYLIPVDARINGLGDVDIESVSASSIMKILGSSPRALHIAILDACRNDPFHRGTQGGLAPMEAPPRSLVAFSTSPNSVAADGPPGGNSFYTAALTGALARSLSTPSLTIMEVFEQAREQVWRVTGNQQLSWEATSMMPGKFYPGDISGLRPPPPPLPVSTAFDRTFGQASFSRIISFPAGGYGIAATTETPDSKKVRLIRVDAAAQKVWEKSFDADGYAAAGAAAAFPNGDLIIAGSTKSSSTGPAKAWILRTDQHGQTLWSKTYGGAGSYGFYSVVAMPDGGLAVAGLSSTSADVRELWAVRCDARGNVLWERTFRHRDTIATPAIAALSDGGVVVAATAKDKDDIDSGTLVLRLDRSGNTLWEKHFDEKRNAIAAVSLPDDSVVIAGLRRKKSYNYASDPWAMRIDGQGKPLWEKDFNVRGEYTANSACCIVRGTEHEVTIVGNVAKDQESRIWMTSVDSKGNALSERTLNGDHAEIANGAVQTERGSVIAGTSGAQDSYSRAGELHVFTLP